MKKFDGDLTTIWQDGKATCFAFETTYNFSIHPGQFLMARGSQDILPIPIYPCDIASKTYTSMSAAGSSWHVGESLSLSGPHGRGFAVASLSHRLLIVSSTNTPLRLLPLAEMVISAGGEVALHARHTPQQLPVEVELLAADRLAEAAAWADWIIGDARLKAMPKWISLFNGSDAALTGKNTQILVDTPLVCAGATECGVCAVKTKQGWKLACSDGPVFLLEDLEMD